MCVYGMEGPGGYQFVGRTLQMWNRFQQTPHFKDGKPWLLRFFDQIRFYPVQRRGAAGHARGLPARQGRHLRSRRAPSRCATTSACSANDASSITAFKTKQRAAFEAERRSGWRRACSASPPKRTAVASELTASSAAGCEGVETHVPGSVWKVTSSQARGRKAGDVARHRRVDEDGNCHRKPASGVVTEVPRQRGSRRIRGAARRRDQGQRLKESARAGYDWPPWGACSMLTSAA